MCVHCVELSQSGSTVVAPGQSTTLTCRVSGYSLTDSSYCTDWIRQPAGKALEWIGGICGDGSTDYSDKLKSRFEVTRDTSSSTVSLRGQNLQTEDTAVYYCASLTASSYIYFNDVWCYLFIYLSIYIMQEIIKINK
uniref:Ig-like domain-containing protein n=1 Tax=Astyanax mexicanus TaxID=7994 RepID=A0A3B1IPF8_ASTMX